MAEGGRPPVHTHSLLTARAAVRGNKVTHSIRLAGHGPAELHIVLWGDQRVTAAEHLRAQHITPLLHPRGTRLNLLMLDTLAQSPPLQIHVRVCGHTAIRLHQTCLIIRAGT